MKSFKQSKYALTLIDPKRAPVDIPDMDMTRCVKKSINLTKNITVPNGSSGEILGLWIPESRTAPLRLYVWVNALSRYVFFQNVVTDQELSDSYTRGRLISACLESYSSTVSQTLASISGTLNAIAYQEIPDVSKLNYSNITAFVADGKSILTNSSIEDGVITLSTPTGSQPYVIFDTENAWSTDSCLTVGTNSLIDPLAWNIAATNIAVAGTSNFYDSSLSNVLPVPANAYGKKRTRVSIRFNATVATLLNFEITLIRETVAADWTTVTNTVVSFQAFPIQAVAGNNSFYYQTQTSSSNLVTRIQVNITNAGAAASVITLVTPSLEIDYMNYYFNGVVGPGSIISIQGLTPTQVLSFNSRMNYEVVPDSTLIQNIPTLGANSDGDFPMEIYIVQKFLSMADEWKLVWSRKEYEYFLRFNKDEFTDLAKMGQAAGFGDFFNFLKPMLPVVGGLLGGPAGATIGTALGGLGDSIFNQGSSGTYKRLGDSSVYRGGMSATRKGHCEGFENKDDDYFEIGVNDGIESDDESIDKKRKKGHCSMFLGDYTQRATDYPIRPDAGICSTKKCPNYRSPFGLFCSPECKEMYSEGVLLPETISVKGQDAGGRDAVLKFTYEEYFPTRKGESALLTKENFLSQSTDIQYILGPGNMVEGTYQHPDEVLSKLKNSTVDEVLSRKKSNMDAGNLFPIIMDDQVYKGYVFVTLAPLVLNPLKKAAYYVVMGPEGDSGIHVSFQSTSQFDALENMGTLDELSSMVEALVNRVGTRAFLTFHSDIGFDGYSFIAALRASSLGISLPLPITGAFDRFGIPYLPAMLTAKARGMGPLFSTMEDIDINQLPLTEVSSINQLVRDGMVVPITRELYLPFLATSLIFNDVSDFVRNNMVRQDKKPLQSMEWFINQMHINDVNAALVLDNNGNEVKEKLEPLLSFWFGGYKALGDIILGRVKDTVEAGNVKLAELEAALKVKNVLKVEKILTSLANMRAGILVTGEVKKKGTKSVLQLVEYEDTFTDSDGDTYGLDDIRAQIDAFHNWPKMLQNQQRMTFNTLKDKFEALEAEFERINTIAVPGERKSAKIMYDAHGLALMKIVQALSNAEQAYNAKIKRRVDAEAKKGVKKPASKKPVIDLEEEAT